MATEQNITGFESGARGELLFSGGLAVGVTVQPSTPRSGTYRLQIATVNSTSNLVQMPAGSVTGTSGTTANGQHKRVRSRAFLRVDAQTVPFGNSQIRIFGLGGEFDATGVNVWMDGNRKLTVKVGSGLPPITGSGYGLSPVSISALSCIGLTAVALATTATPHGFQSTDVVIVAGAANPVYNGTVTITVISPTSFSYPIASYQLPTSGTMTATYVSGPTLTFIGPIAASVWHNFTLDVDYIVGADTLVTATLTVIADSGTPFDQTMQVTGSIGATDAMGKVTFLSERIRSGFDYQMTLSVDDVVYMAASGADAAAALVLPTAARILPVLATGIQISNIQVNAGPDQVVSRAVGATLAGTVIPSYQNSWSADTNVNKVNEVPVNTGGDLFFESTAPSGSYIMFSHASAASLGITAVAAWKVYSNGRVASGTGAIEALLGALAQARTWATTYGDIAGSVNPAMLVDWNNYTPAQFDLTVFGVRKQNGTQDTFLGNILSEALVP